MSNDAIDTDRLKHKATSMAADFLGQTTRDIIVSIDDKANLAKDFGVRSDLVDSLLTTIKNFFNSIMVSLGLTPPTNPAPATSPVATSTTPPPTDSAAARAAAAAAATPNAGNGTNVASNSAPAKTPPAPQPQVAARK